MHAFISNTPVPHLSFVLGSEFFNAEAYGCVQLVGTVITWFLSGSLLVQCCAFAPPYFSKLHLMSCGFSDDFFYTNHLDGDLKFIKVAGAHHRDFCDPAFMYQILVWVCLAVDQVRSMAVTAGAWQSLVVAWGNPTNFYGTSVFPFLTVPLTGIGEFSTQPILQRADRAINRILHCSDFFCLVIPHKTSLSCITSNILIGEYGP
jgi:hypothetical protein